MQPIRVLQVVTVMNLGGLETMLMNYYREMDRDKIQFDFMVHRQDRGHYDDEIESLGGKIYRMPPIRPGKYRLYFHYLENFFINHSEYKIIHSHINENSSFVLKAAKKANIPCRIAHSHTSNLGLDYKFPLRMYARMTMKGNPSHYFACSMGAGEWLFGKKITKSGQLLILKNAINLDSFTFNQDVRNQTRNQLEVNHQFVIGHVGRFHKSKNHEFLIDVFNSIHNKRQDAVLILVGEGDNRPKIEKKIASLGLTQSVKFLGRRNDIHKLMQAMDCFIFPSYFEGAPVVLVEAQAAGLPCIVSDTISRDNDLTGMVEFRGLREPAEVWAEQALLPRSQRIDTSEQLLKHGYNISGMANHLRDFYINNQLSVL